MFSITLLQTENGLLYGFGYAFDLIEYRTTIQHNFIFLGMLPKPVADDLRQGRTAEAQSYSNATVYFRWVLLTC